MEEAKVHSKNVYAWLHVQVPASVARARTVPDFYLSASVN